MNITQVREHLHRLIDEVDDIYVLNGLYRTLLADKQQREAYEKEQAQKAKKQNGNTARNSGNR
jgi:hypothetical protein